MVGVYLLVCEVGLVWDGGVGRVVGVVVGEEGGPVWVVGGVSEADGFGAFGGLGLLGVGEVRGEGGIVWGG